MSNVTSCWFRPLLAKNTTVDDETAGDQYTFLACDRRTKLVLAHFVGKRTKENTAKFLTLLRQRTVGRFAPQQDGYVGYSYNTIRSVFGHDIDFGIERKYFAQEKRAAPL